MVLMQRHTPMACHSKPIELSLPATLPSEGSKTAQLKVLNEEFSSRQARFTFEAPGGSSYQLPVRVNRANVSVNGGELAGNQLRLHFPEGAGYQAKTVVIAW